MADVVARCPDCGREHPDPFSQCDWCGRREPSRWWCLACLDWRAARACPACAGGLRVPSELNLGEFVGGATVPFRFAVWNMGKKPVDCPVTTDSGATLDDPRLSVTPGGTAVVRGELVVPAGAHGRHAFRIAFDAPEPCETLLTLDAVPPAPRLDFLPALLLLRAANPGGVVRSSVALRNSGNVELTARLTPGAAWLATEPKLVTLAPGESAEVKVRARSKKTDSGSREATLSATADGAAWSATVRLALPDPLLAADAVEFGELRPGRAAFAEVVIRNVGRVRVNGTVEAEVGWLTVSPARVTLQPGREKTVRVRAALSDEDGPLTAELLVRSETGVALRVPVSAVAVVPRPLLRAVRRQKLRDAIGAPVERKFQIANDGDGRLTVTATSDVPWLQIETPTLRVAPGKKRKLRYVVDLPELACGEHSGTITLESNGGTAVVPVTVEVLEPNPLLEVVPPPDLGMISPQFPLAVFVQVRNAGIGLLRVKAESESGRVVVSPRQLDVPPGPPVRFNLSVPVAGLPGGEHEAAVRLTSNGGDGRAAVRFKLPVEHIDAPSLIDLGIREAGVPTGGAVQLRNAGPYPVALTLRGEQPWLRPGVERVTIPPRETTAVAFRVEPPEDAEGPLVGTLTVEGRAVRRSVAVRLIASRVELVAEPDTIDLADLAPGAERRFAVSVLNMSELPAVTTDAHAAGELEVWVRRAAVPPGERVTVHGVARVNATQTGQRVRTDVSLGHGLTLRCEASVVAPVLPRVLAAAVAAGGLVAGGALSVAVGWWLGVPLGLAAMLFGAWLIWRELA